MTNIRNNSLIVFIIIAVLTALALSGCSSNGFENGKYTCDCSLEGGTGRASIERTIVDIEEDAITAEITWNSSHWEYMVVEDQKYEPINTSGNSTFIIPISLDEEVPVSALTNAMSQPHLIDYVLRFDSASMEKIEE